MLYVPPVTPSQKKWTSPSQYLLTNPIPHRYTPCIFSNHHLRLSKGLMAPLWGRWFQTLDHYQHSGNRYGGRCKGEAWTLKSTVRRGRSISKPKPS